MNYPVILFYKYVEIADTDVFAGRQRSLCESLGLKGRLLIASEGINGTLAGTAENVNRYVTALRTEDGFSDIEIKRSPGDASTFPKLVVKVRREIVTLNAGAIRADKENHLTPTEWKDLMENNRDVVLLDIRNRFESAAGRFENAVTCDIEHFRELPEYVDRLQHLKKKTVLMYCTGGIRCEKASTLFRQNGFQSVFQLHGGIAAYQEQFGNEHWQGECFVFDQRMTVRVEEGLVQIGRCAHTGRPTSRFVNCLHDPCHKLFILSDEAEAENRNHRLCPECLEAGITFDNAEYRDVATTPAQPNSAAAFR
ncbi:MAG: hypothetical protein QOI07_789 [Verrucomicrobiota bacterium]|jgi:UPF0176 protein